MGKTRGATAEEPQEGTIYRAPTVLGGVSAGSDVEIGFKVGERFGHVFAAEAESDMAGFVVDGAGKEEDAGVADKSVAEGLDVMLGLEAGEADGGGVGRSPVEEICVAREKSGEQGKIAENDLEIAINEFLAMTEGEGGEKFAGSAGADGGVVLERNYSLKEISVARGEPG